MGVYLKYVSLPLLVFVFLMSFNMRYNLIGVTFLIYIIQSMAILSTTFSGGVRLFSVFYVFNIIFLGIVPWIHYSSNALIWRSSLIMDETYLSLNFILIILNFLVAGIYVVSLKNSKKKNSYFIEVKSKKYSILVLLLISFAGCMGVFIINDFSINNILFRGLVDENRQVVIQSSSLSLIIGMITRLAPVFCFLYAVTQIKDYSLYKFALFVLMLLSVFPTGIPRYMVAFVYIPIILIYFPAFRNSFYFVIGLIFSIIFIFPFLDQFRYFSGLENLRFIPIVEFFYAGHFDAYENFASAFESEFVSHGIQLIGVILFFIPRTLWLDKPVGSGYEMAINSGYVFNNISMPFLAEGYVNFGVLGIFLFAIILAFVMARVDGNFHNKKIFNIFGYHIAVYYFLIGAIFFLFRGDFLSSFSFIFSGILISIVVGKIMNVVNK